MTLRLAWFATARGTSSHLLFKRACEAIKRGELDVEIACVFCNREFGQSPNTDAFLSDVRKTGIPLIAKSSGAWRKRVSGKTSDPTGNLAPWRRDYDEWIRRHIMQYEPDVALLAGYMLVVTDALCNALPMLNLHPAAPGGPEGTWQQVITRLIEGNAEESGLQMQQVTTELDRGPIVTSCTYPIHDGKFERFWLERPDPSDQDSALFQAIRKAGVQREGDFIIETLREYSLDPADPPMKVDVSSRVERLLHMTYAPPNVRHQRNKKNASSARTRKSARTPMPALL